MKILRDLSNDTALLSLNTATVREQWNLKQIIDGCVRHGIGAISPWRDQSLAALTGDPILDNLRDVPRFEVVLERLDRKVP